MATTVEQRGKIEELKRQVWAAKTIAEDALADSLHKKNEWARAEAKCISARLTLDALRNSLIAALDELA